MIFYSFCHFGLEGESRKAIYRVFEIGSKLIRVKVRHSNLKVKFS